MGKNSAIGWTHHTFNAWEGCVKISSECDNCYAETRNNRFNGGQNWGPGSPRLARSDAYWRSPLKWDRAAAKLGEHHRVFCSSLADVFERHDDPEIDAWMDEQRARLWDLIEETPNLDWLILSKRPENIQEMIPPAWWDHPRENVWLGVTAGTQASADLRIPILLETPAAVRFVSCEPMLERIYFAHRLERIDWLIVGCESGFGSRPIYLEWVRWARDQCRVADVAFFLKQLPIKGRPGKVETEPQLDGRRWVEFPR